jgi:hypothetical protein
MKAKRTGYKTFKLDRNVTIECNSYVTRYSWGHEAELYINGHMESCKKITYYNRTWESYTYQTILRNIVEGVSNKLIDKKRKLEYVAIIQNENFSQDKDIFKSIALVAKMGELLTTDKKEANDWKVRMLKAGLQDKGLIMPEDWPTLSEPEKEKRLNGAIEQLL